MNNKFKNILVGMSSAFVIMPIGTVAQIRPPQKSDAENLANDWKQVGNDLRSAMNQVSNEQKK